MKVLLDSHTLVWAITEPELLGRDARKVIEDPNNLPLVSAASAWEIAMKVRVGRWREAKAFESRFHEGIGLAGYELLSIHANVALRAGRLPGPHGDPFDRMIAAQALELDVPVVSRDSALDSFGVHRIW